ncbi:MAG: YraN family protein [Candidatus Berkelbacteria bacterium]|nr:YraN family protein [Candidatus Berkelbacteria bacterium]
MDKTKNKSTGNWGEDRATGYLEKIGYEIIERNLKLFCGEIDILARDKKTIVVVEVKTVWGSGWGTAIELVRRKKEKKLRLLASVITKDYPKENIRVDVIGIDSGVLTHIKNAVGG